jgi:hypothetical protein
LSQFTAELQQLGAVFNGLYPFGNHIAAKGARQTNHGRNNSQVVRVIKHIPHETLVDLE